MRIGCLLLSLLCLLGCIATESKKSLCPSNPMPAEPIVPGTHVPTEMEQALFRRALLGREQAHWTLYRVDDVSPSGTLRAILRDPAAPNTFHAVTLRPPAAVGEPPAFRTSVRIETPCP